MPEVVLFLREAGWIAVPTAAAVALVLWVMHLRLRDGVPVARLPFDRRFLTAFLYSGALLSIYLSCVYFYRLSLR